MCLSTGVTRQGMRGRSAQFLNEKIIRKQNLTGIRSGRTERNTNTQRQSGVAYSMFLL